jgi:hypothetical protein
VVPDHAEGVNFCGKAQKKASIGAPLRRVVDWQHVLYSAAGATWRSGDAADCKSASLFLFFNARSETGLLNHPNTPKHLAVISE